jgi:hypothetical protein
MPWVQNFEGLLDFLSVVIVHAPGDFPKEDYLRDDEQLTLELAFEELRNGMQFVAEKIKDDAMLRELESYLDLSFLEYRQGHDVKGAHLLQDFERTILKRVKR